MSRVTVIGDTFVKVVRVLDDPIVKVTNISEAGAPGPAGTGGALKAEFLSETSARVWNLSATPLSAVSVFDGNPLQEGYDYTISGTVVTFLLIDPVAPYAIYTA